MGPASVWHRQYTGTESPHFLLEQQAPPHTAVLVSDQGKSHDTKNKLNFLF